jgi:membrane protein implicated in regulation of membrane protease activity
LSTDTSLDGKPFFVKNDKKEEDLMETVRWFKHRALGLQILFIAIVLYAVSSVLVLGISLGVLPYLHYKFYLKDNIEYAVISFLLTAAISAYHLSAMFRTKKRKTDRVPDAPVEQVHWFKGKTAIAQALFVLILLYAAGTVAALCLIPGLILYMPGASLPHLCIGYSIISFGLAALISAYYMSTMIRRRKRKTDHVVAAPAA